MLGAFQETLETWLRTERVLPKAQRRTARRLFEGLQVEGYRGAYDSVQRFVQRWKAAKSGPALTQAFVPLAFAPGEVCQFDWSHEHVELGGVMQTIKVAHFRLTFSRQMFVVAYPRETQEMVFDAHNRAFAFFGGVPQRMVYDNLIGGGGNDLHGQRAPVQPPLHGAGQPLSIRTGRLHPGVRLGEGAGREPGRQYTGMAVHAAGAVCQLRGVERMAGHALSGTGAAQASGDPGAFDRHLLH
jgi:hypothetical protein